MFSVQHPVPKLKHFVKIPINEIALENEVQISPRITLFDEREDYLQSCFKALVIL